MECPSCSTVQPDEAHFCQQCGTPMPKSAIEAPPDPLQETLKVALGRQYQVLRLLGKGGMGAVYLALETALEREVAIKVLPPEHGATQESRDRFRREARTAARLSHPNIVPLHTFGDVDGTLFFVMGYVKGESLAAKLRREGRQTVEEARRILVEIAQALEYAHNLGIIHRDIKPDNVLIEERAGRAMLLDFGVAKGLGAGQTLTVQGSLLGTPHYMSPEQAMGKSDVDHRSDLYSLGIMGYEMLAGQRPFEGKTTGDVLVQHITKEALPLKTVAPEIPVELAAALTRCLAKDPAQRWTDARSLLGGLAPAQEDDLPHEMEELPGLITASLISVLLIFYGVIWWAGGGHMPDPFVIAFAMLVFMLSLFTLGWIWKWWSLRREGYDSWRIVYESFKQPTRWIGWYPRRFRPRGDVWDRLPAELKKVRAWIGLFIVAPFLITVPALIFNQPNPEIEKTLKKLLLLIGSMTSVVPLIAAIILTARWRKKVRAQGLFDARLESRLTTVSTGKRSFWSKPEVAVFLLPAGAGRGTGSSTSPRDLVDAVSGIVGSLQAPARESGERALEAVRRLAASVQSLDKEIASLEGTVDSSEANRLVAKLEALGTGSSATGNEVRAVVQKQLELVQGLERRLSEVKARRAHHLELMKSLWQQVAALGASASGSTKSVESADRIRALCSEISSQITGERGGSAPIDDSIEDLPTLHSKPARPDAGS